MRYICIKKRDDFTVGKTYYTNKDGKPIDDVGDTRHAMSQGLIDDHLLPMDKRFTFRGEEYEIDRIGVAKPGDIVLYSDNKTVNEWNLNTTDIKTILKPLSSASPKTIKNDTRGLVVGKKYRVTKDLKCTCLGCKTKWADGAGGAKKGETVTVDCDLWLKVKDGDIVKIPQNPLDYLQPITEDTMDISYESLKSKGACEKGLLFFKYHFGDATIKKHQFKSAMNRSEAWIENNGQSKQSWIEWINEHYPDQPEWKVGDCFERDGARMIIKINEKYAWIDNSGDARTHLHESVGELMSGSWENPKHITKEEFIKEPLPW